MGMEGLNKKREGVDHEVYSGQTLFQQFAQAQQIASA